MKHGESCRRCNPDGGISLSGLHGLATEEAVEYSLSRARSVERKLPMLGLVYRVVAEVLFNEQQRQTTQEEKTA